MNGLRFLSRIQPWELDTTEQADYRNELILNKAKAEESNTFTDILDFVGPIFQKAGMHMINAGLGGMQGNLAKLTQGTPEYAKLLSKINTVKGFQNGFGFLNDMSTLFALGNTPSAPIQGYAEGGEVLEYPNGQMEELQGPTHEKGGIPVQLDPLTKIYSDRIKIDGVSIAKRNKKRERRNVTLREIINRNPYDTILKKSWEKHQKNNSRFKDIESQLQNSISNLIN